MNEKMNELRELYEDFASFHDSLFAFYLIASTSDGSPGVDLVLQQYLLSYREICLRLHETLFEHSKPQGNFLTRSLR